MSATRMSPWARLSTKVTWPSQFGACWKWAAYKIRSGYGMVYCGQRRRMVVAHRFVYELFCGLIPEGLELDHLCFERDCVNPLHLEPVSSRENYARSRQPGAIQVRTNKCARGHDLSGSNVYERRDRGRRCRACERIRDVARRRKASGDQQGAAA